MESSKVTAHHRLASYGTLAPGRPNYHQLDGLTGEWFTGTVKGTLIKAGWGTHLGFPGLILGPDGEAIEVHIFQSGDLPEHWERLDAFEGEAYQRVETIAETERGRIPVSIYQVLPENED